MTLNLDDGTKITIHTTPHDQNKNMTLPRPSWFITKGDQAMVIQGLDQNTPGDPQIGQVSKGASSRRLSTTTASTSTRMRPAAVGSA